MLLANPTPPPAAPAAVSFLGASLSEDFTILVGRGRGQRGALALPRAALHLAVAACWRPARVPLPAPFPCSCLAPKVTEYCEGGALSANLAAGRISWYRRGKQVRVLRGC